MTNFKEGDEPIIFAEEMELRDYFAAKVVQGDLSKNGCMSVYETARFAYQVADAMLEVRNENNQ